MCACACASSKPLPGLQRARAWVCVCVCVCVFPEQALMTPAPVLKEREMQGKARQLGRERKNIRLVAAKGRTLSQDELDAKHAPKLAGAPSGLQGRGAVWDPEGGMYVCMYVCIFYLAQQCNEACATSPLA